MPYIGTSPSNGVRRVHTYTATASQTTFSGASSEGVTLSYADTNYIDVFQNGVLLGSADYTSTSGTSVVLAQGASADDLIVIVVYDVFSVADTVSKTNGGSFDSGVTMSSTLGVTGATTLTGALSAKGGAVFNEDSADVDFRVESNGNANMLFVDGGNDKVGIGTNPSQLLDVVGASANIRVAESSGGDLRMNVSGSTGGIGTHSNHPLLFRTNSTEHMRLHSNGRVDVGTGSYTGSAKLTVTHVGSSVVGIRLSDETSSGTHNNIQFLRNGTQVGKIETTNQTSTAYVTSSDYRMKNNVNYSWDATTKLKQLKPAEFTWREEFDTDQTQVQGFLAHEVQSVVPEAVTGTHNEVDDDGNPVMQGIDQSKIVPLLVKTIQELEARITALENAE